MRAAVISDGSIALGERPDPVPGDEELLVRVAFAGLNGADLGQLAGRYPPPNDRIDPSVPGLEIAGEVVGLGAHVDGFALGERVMGIVAGGGQAELATIHARHALRVPAAIGLEAAGGFPETFLTAFGALFAQADLRPGERLLVTGAAGGVGLAGVQLGLAAGATVVASVRHPSHRPPVAALGALALGVDEAYESGPYDAVLELVGGEGVARDLAALATWGRVTVIGTGAGTQVALDLRQLMGRRATLHGSTLRNRTLEEKAVLARRVEREVLPHLESGRVSVLVEEVFPLERVAEAYARFTAGAKLGKVLVAL